MERHVICKAFQIGQKNYVCLVEDSAQPCGSSLNNKKVVIFGDASDLSFYPTKNLFTTREVGPHVQKVSS